MIGGVAKYGRAPAAWAASFLVAGILLGAWSVTGRAGAILLTVVCGAVLYAASLGGDLRLAKLALAVFWLALGFLSGLSRVALPANEARQTFWRLPVERDRSDRIEGVLADFWVGQPPRAHNMKSRIVTATPARTNLRPSGCSGARNLLSTKRLPATAGQLPSRRQAASNPPTISSRAAIPGSSGISLNPVTV